jgi:hypothetical protein
MLQKQLYLYVYLYVYCTEYMYWSGIMAMKHVLIHDDNWLIQTMHNTTVDMIVHECVSTNKYTP